MTNWKRRIIKKSLHPTLSNEVFYSLDTIIKNNYLQFNRPYDINILFLVIIFSFDCAIVSITATITNKKQHNELTFHDLLANNDQEDQQETSHFGLHR